MTDILIEESMAIESSNRNCYHMINKFGMSIWIVPSINIRFMRTMVIKLMVEVTNPL